MAFFGRPLHHVVIEICPEEISPANNDDSQKTPAYLDNVHFFTKYLSVQNLCITGHLGWPSMFQFIENILLSCSSDLVQVEIKMSIDEDAIKGDDLRREFCGGKIFNTVKKLVLSFYAEEEFEVSAIRVGQILAAFPNILDLWVDAGLLRLVFREGSLCPSFLSTLRVTEDMTGSQCAALLNLTQPLKSLYIQAAFNPPSDDWDEKVDIDVAPVLYNVLSRHRHTLEYLALGLDELCRRSVWKLPNFPNLKRFNCLSGCEEAVTFESRSINHSETFPRLESLRFAEWDGDWTPCFQSFFPARAGICQSVRKFHISEWLEPDSSSDEEDEEGRIDARFGRILKFFPNADHLFMQRLKRYLTRKKLILK
ncbi:uncharacterized protein LOC110861845 isoform X1 [Folsomia candida]|uniref:uncharacterized protein LOC110861845 isoform X1 n=1 Tax=Folsomia candida TaxID=158441 RepID=UPI001604FC33|nr:uncharacterized protein LOC110861845 isoform X1 [Folsomia candida]